MVNYRTNRDRIKINELGSLYLNRNISKGTSVVIYIGGQMEHRLHTLEDATSLTFDSGHKIFNGSFMYEYPIIKGNKSNINAVNFADNLTKAIEIARLEDVIIITESYGGLIAACASKSPRIQKVIATHPPILGTSLASNAILIDNLNKLEKQQRLLAKSLTWFINDCYGFQKDNYLGINNPNIFKNIDLTKLTVVGSALDREKDKNNLACNLYDIIYALTGEKSDGVVIWNEETLRKYGINYLTESNPTNHFDTISEKYISKVASNCLENFNFKDYEEFKKVLSFGRKSS